MTELFKIPDAKKIRVIIDTDAACEADDPFAIAHALMSPKLIVKGILAEHFNEPGSVARSYDEIQTVLKTMGLESKVPVLMGQDGRLDEDESVSEAVQFLIDEAMRGSYVRDGAAGTETGNADGTVGADSADATNGVAVAKSNAAPAPWDKRPLYILCQGAITNVAKALRVCPAIKDRIIIIWIGTRGAADSTSGYGAAVTTNGTSDGTATDGALPNGSGATNPLNKSQIVPAPFREYNAGNDITAANEVLESGAEVWLIPASVYSTITVGLAELKQKVAPYGAIGRHLYDNMIAYNLSERAGWTQGESWSLGDSPAIAVAINPGCGKFIYAKAPHINDDTGSAPKADNPVVRIYTRVDSRYILEDFFAKLQQNYPRA